MQNTLDQLAVGTCYKSVCYSFPRKYTGLVARCGLQIAITYVFSYTWKNMSPFLLDNTNYKGSVSLKMLSVYLRAEVSWLFAI